jgi:hypothetical protein
MRKNMGLDTELRSTLSRTEQSTLRNAVNGTGTNGFFAFLNNSAQIEDLGLNNRDWRVLLRDFVQKHQGQKYRSLE